MLKCKTNESQSHNLNFNLQGTTNIFAWLCGMREKVSFVICKYRLGLFNMHVMSPTWSSLRLVEEKIKKKHVQWVFLKSNYPISAPISTHYFHTQIDKAVNYKYNWDYKQKND